MFYRYVFAETILNVDYKYIPYLLYNFCFHIENLFQTCDGTNKNFSLSKLEIDNRLLPAIFHFYPVTIF